MNDRALIIRKASWIALLGNFVLAVGKITTGLLSGSLSVLSDGTDSATDVLISIMTLLAGRMAAKPGDREHPYGHGRAETMATAVIAFVVFFAGAQLFMNAAGALIRGETSTMPESFAFWVTLASVIGKLILAWTQFRYGKQAGSSMLIANGKNMRGDVVTSAAVLIGLGAGYLFNLPILDRVLALLVSLWIIRNAIGIFLEANTELMDGTKDHGPYDALFAAVASVPEAGNPHRVRIRRMGSMLMADLDIEVPPQLSVSEAHGIAMRVEAAIKEKMPEVYDILVHIEPQGNAEAESYGLTPGMVSEKDQTE
ncbi:MAG: cation diffusion facilitator family transporter [Rectinema sp.]